MKKKKLKQRIAELESELGQAKSNEEIWKSMFDRIIADLKGYGVKTEIIPVEPTAIEATRVEDAEEKYIHGINTVPPTLSFDFTEHDKILIQKNNGFIFDKTNINGKYEWNMPGRRKEDNEPKEIKQCREILKRENKCYIYISNFFARPMGYEALGTTFEYKAIPIVKIKYSNGIESEVAITELMKYDTLEKCEKRCEELNEEMKEYRELWSKDYWKMISLMRENEENN